MAAPDRAWLLIAVSISLIIHISFISPISTWLNRSFIPAAFEEGFEIQLIEDESPEKEIIEDPVMNEPPPDDTNIKKVYRDLPDFTKNLSEKATEDNIVLPEKDDAGLKNDEVVKLDENFFEKLLEQPLVKKTVVEPYESKKENIPEKNKDVEDVQSVSEQEAVVDQKPIVEQEDLNEISNVSDPQNSATAEIPVEKLSKSIIEPEPQLEIASISPLFRKKVDIKKPTSEKPVSETPDIIKNSFRGIEPEGTNEDNIQFSMNTYKWTFERYMENWAVDLSKWWSAPTDYRLGKVPDGGYVWVRVRLQKTGRLLGYKVFKSNLTAEMELSVIQALIGSLERPLLPDTFPEKELIINWKFIYPPIDSKINMRKKRN